MKKTRASQSSMQTTIMPKQMHNLRARITDLNKEAVDLSRQNLEIVVSDDWSSKYEILNKEDKRYGNHFRALYERFINEGMSKTNASQIRIPSLADLKKGPITASTTSCPSSDFYEGLKFIVLLVTKIPNVTLKCKERKGESATTIRIEEAGTPLGFAYCYEALPKKEWPRSNQQISYLRHEHLLQIAKTDEKKLRRPRLEMVAYLEDYSQDMLRMSENDKHIHTLGDALEKQDDFDQKFVNSAYTTIPNFYFDYAAPSAAAAAAQVAYLAHLAVDSRFSLGKLLIQSLLKGLFPRHYVFLELDVLDDNYNSHRHAKDKLRSFYINMGFQNVADLKFDSPARLFARHAFMEGWLDFNFDLSPLEMLIDSDPEEYIRKPFMVCDTNSSKAAAAASYASTAASIRTGGSSSVKRDEADILMDQYVRAVNMDMFYDKALKYSRCVSPQMHSQSEENRRKRAAAVVAATAIAATAIADSNKRQLLHVVNATTPAPHGLFAAAARQPKLKSK